MLKDQKARTLNKNVHENFSIIIIKNREDLKMLFICYPKCTTCQKALKWLSEKGIEPQIRDIKENNPNKKELQQWFAQSNLPLKKFFNTSGLKYKELGLAKKLADMSEDEQLELLASDGMLVKRPLLIGKNFVLVGFKQTEWECTF